MRRNTKKGFTLIEIVLVVGLTGLILAGLLSGISFTISRQRYDESVQDYADFLRKVYSEVTNVENPLDSVIANNNLCTVASLDGKTIPEAVSSSTSASTGGRSNCAFYGKLISFGENAASSSDGNYIYVYDVIGRAYDITQADSNANIIDSYKSNIAADILSVAPVDTAAANSTECTVKPFNTYYSYRPTNAAIIETTTAGEAFSGLVLIARSPASNSVYTYFSTATLRDTASGKGAHQADSTGVCINTLYDTVKPLTLHNALTTTTFTQEEINFCVASGDVFASGNARRNVQIAKNGHNSSSVRLVNTDQVEDTSSTARVSVCES